jgi:hypothetical protein
MRRKILSMDNERLLVALLKDEYVRVVYNGKSLVALVEQGEQDEIYQPSHVIHGVFPIIKRWRRGA